MESTSLSPLNVDRLYDILRQESHYTDIDEHEQLGSLFARNPDGLASAILLLQIASDQTILFGSVPEQRSALESLKIRTVGDIIGLLRAAHQRDSMPPRAA